MSCTEICGTGQLTWSRMSTSHRIFTGTRKESSGAMENHPSACSMNLGLRMPSGMLKYVCDDIDAVLMLNQCAASPVTDP